MKVFFAILFLSALARAEGLPTQPTASADPGSDSYSYSVFHETISISGREVEIFAPAELKSAPQKAPVVVFGHGQAIASSAYLATMEHLAKKGVAVIFPAYDNGFFDQDWRRMGHDYVNLTAETLKRYGDYMDAKKVIFSGHSKGGYIAIIAASLPRRDQVVVPSSVILFQPAGYDAEYLRQMDPNIPVTITWADADTIVKEPAVKEIYERSPAMKKQYIVLSSYRGTQPELAADHFFILNEGSIMGGHDGISPFHYYGAWKWLLGGAWDLQSNERGSNPYLYGEEAGSTGLGRIQHKIQRNWK